MLFYYISILIVFCIDFSAPSLLVLVLVFEINYSSVMKVLHIFI